MPHLMGGEILGRDSIGLRPPVVASAAEDYGQPDLIDLSDIRDDAGVVALINALKALAADEAFADFLQSPVEGEEMEAVEEESETPDDMDSMFMSRS